MDQRGQDEGRETSRDDGLWAGESGEAGFVGTQRKVTFL